LHKLVDEGIIVAGTKWKDVYPLFSEEEAFQNMIGQGGSDPLELFWDIMEQLDSDFRLKRDYVLDVLQVFPLEDFLTVGKTV